MHTTSLETPTRERAVACPPVPRSRRPSVLSEVDVLDALDRLVAVALASRVARIHVELDPGPRDLHVSGVDATGVAIEAAGGRAMRLSGPWPSHRTLRERMSGLGVEVVLHGQRLDRPDALGAGFTRTGLGMLRLAPAEPGTSDAHAIWAVSVYAGGQIVEGFRGPPGSALHLDEAAWPLEHRAPARVRRPGAFREALQAQVAQARAAELVRACGRYDARLQEFADDHHALLLELRDQPLAASLWDRIGVMPRQSVRMARAVPARGCDLACVEHPRPLQAPAVRRGDVLVIDSAQFEDFADPREIALALWCCLSGAALVDSTELPLEHWLREHLVTSFVERVRLSVADEPAHATAKASRAPELRVIGPRRAQPWRHAIGARQICWMHCEAVEVQFAGETHRTQAHAGVVDGVLYVPPGAGASSVLHVVDCTDERGNYDDQRARETVASFAVELQGARDAAASADIATTSTDD